MSDNDKFILKLIEATKKKTIVWYKLNSKYTNIFISINTENAVKDNPILFKIHNSYYTSYKNGNIFITPRYYANEPEHDLISISVQGRPDATIVEQLISEDKQSDLIRLYNLVERQYQNVEDLINDFINDESI